MPEFTPVYSLKGYVTARLLEADPPEEVYRGVLEHFYGWKDLPALRGWLLLSPILEGGTGEKGFGMEALRAIRPTESRVTVSEMHFPQEAAIRQINEMPWIWRINRPCSDPTRLRSDTAIQGL